MPPRKRRSRRHQDETPEPVVASAPEPAPEPVQEPVSAPVLTRATQELVPDLGMVISRRPADGWRERMTAVWSPAGTCPACHLPRYLMLVTGHMAVCDLYHEVAFLTEQGLCVCSYDVLERRSADAPV